MKTSNIGIRVGAYVLIAILAVVSWITSGALNLEPAVNANRK